MLCLLTSSSEVEGLGNSAAGLVLPRGVVAAVRARFEVRIAGMTKLWPAMGGWRSAGSRGSAHSGLENRTPWAAQASQALLRSWAAR